MGMARAAAEQRRRRPPAATAGTLDDEELSARRPTHSYATPSVALVWARREIRLDARPRGFHVVTDEVARAVPEMARVEIGLLHVLIAHTSASLALNENASRAVLADFRSWFDRAIPEDAPYWTHRDEGPDDMPAHVKSALLDSSLTLPVAGGRLALGTWQGIYLCEHRDRGGPRRLVGDGLGRVALPPPRMRTCVRALGGAEGRSRGGPDAAGLPRSRGRPHLRRARGPRHPLLRGPLPLGPEPRAEGLAMPFRWTINPYRGCSHACIVLPRGDTPILMARRTDQAARRRPRRRPRLRHRSPRSLPPLRGDGGARPLVDDQAGLPRHVGGRDGADRERRSPVPDRPGVEARHRRRSGADQRPHLTLNDEHGRDRAVRRGRPEDWPDYRRGYLCGLIRGDGHLASYRYESPRGAGSTVHRFRLALTDLEALGACQALPAGGARRDRPRSSPSATPRAPVRCGRSAPASATTSRRFGN